MQQRAIIFDMDGVLIQSESLWSRAEVEIFGALGVPLKEEMCSQTQGMRIDDLVNHWYVQFPWARVSLLSVTEQLICRVIHLVETEGQPMPGAIESIKLIQEMGLPLGLATSSSMRLVQAVLKRLKLKGAFDVLKSAEAEVSGKPHPAVYLSVAQALGIRPQYCIAFEDSIRGVISAKAAGMQCIAVPEPEQQNNPQFEIANLILPSLQSVNQPWLEALLAQPVF